MEKIELDNNQKLVILKTWNDNPTNPPSVSNLISLAFPNLPSEQLDARNVYGRAVKDFLIEKGFKVPKVAYKPKGLLELTHEQREYIANNYSSMSVIEMARVLFKNSTLLQQTQEAKTVYAYVETLPKIDKFQSGAEGLVEDYSPPNTLDRLCARINRYIKDANLNAQKLTPLQKKDCESLMGYLNNVRLVHQISQYIDPDDRMIFESSFIENCHNKADLTFEDVDQYIILSTEKVIAARIQRTIILLEEEQKRTQEETGRLSMALVEQIKNTGEEYNQCIKRQQSLYKSLTEERSKKLSKEIENKASLISLVNAWKNAEIRKNILMLAKKEKENLRTELHELENLEATKLRILGLSVDQILND